MEIGTYLNICHLF